MTVALLPRARRSTALAAGAKRLDIQGLRAVAVLLVVADHLFHFPVGGFVGVDVFFVISGFLITGILLREHSRTGRISFRGFYARRLRRIVPAATVVVVATVIGAYFLFPFTRFEGVAFDGLWSSLFVGNWHMAAVGVDYFQLGQPPSPLQHYWSLSVEEQFYFVWPWLMLGLLFAFGRLRRGSGHVALEVAMAVIIVVSFAWSVVQTAADPTVAYFSTFTRAWELGAGALLALMMPLVSRLPRRIRPIMGWTGLAGIAASAAFISPDLPFPGPWALAPVAATVLVIAAGTGESYAIAPLTNRVSTYIGDISYSLYLWHFPVLSLLLAVMPATSPLYLLTAVVAMFVLAALSYRFVESAFRHKPAGADRARTTWPAVLATVTAAGLVACVALALAGPPAVEARATPPQAPATSVSCLGAAYVANSGACDPSDLPAAVVPSVGDLFNDSGDTFLCFRERDKPMKTCHYGDDSAPMKVALVGDSHAAQLLTPIRASLDELGWSLDTYLGYGCQWQSPPSPDCDVMTDISAALDAGKYDVVVTSGARWVGGDSGDYSEAYARAWKKAADDGARVVVIADVPQPSEEALACISRLDFDPRDNACGTPQKEALSATDPLLKAVKQSDADRVHLVDLSDFYCAAGFCPSVIGGVQVFRDTGAHMSGTWLMSLRPYLVADLERALARP